MLQVGMPTASILPKQLDASDRLPSVSMPLDAALSPCCTLPRVAVVLWLLRPSPHPSVAAPHLLRHCPPHPSWA